MNHVQRFARELQRQNPAPERLALAIAGMAFPELDVGVALDQLATMADHMRRALVGTPPGQARARRFIDVLTHDLGFTGNRDNYYEPANSFLNVVLDQRTGLPIMLSLVCMAMARQLDLDIVGVGFPGHFMARYSDTAGSWLLDPFNGEVVECADADTYLSHLFQRPVTLPPEMHEAVSTVALTQRILNNLRNVYLSRGEYLMAAAVIDYLLVLAPASADLWQERGLLHFYSERWEKAAHDLKRYFFLRGQYLLALGHDPEADAVLATLAPHHRQLLDIFKQIEETRRRLN
jgi:regulator of sirC expression with transglutaminase-like and TPR domain